ncbi:MBL fold metallo-hydrolase [Phenylobacterium sp. J367]|uniref:MBL fold metallo-hydrolase n=1 Tax=Phenylobacterium sp. J367 TaxID=2898435 RepID=UPI0021510D59|nr:MBL fold metallo-hydrolase [Phenylobacterium sp. J367]MCR5878150.1 MBL fold metallo-hydrolase [Phenylobacterium sp. J367]
MRISGFLTGLYALLFAALGLGLWLAPEAAATRLHLAALGDAGVSTLRADLGGLFLALSALAAIGLFGRRPLALWAAAGVLGAIVAGRLVDAVAGVPGREGLVALAVEVVGAAVFAWRARQGGGQARPRLWTGLAAGAGVLAAAAGALALPAVQDALMRRAFQDVVARDQSALLAPDALRVAVCGSSAPLPSSRRAKACVAVMAGGRFYVVDVGPESVEVLMQWGVPLDRIGGVFLTHFHSDHIGDLGELNLQTWVRGRAAQLAVYGGPGVDEVVGGFDRAYRLDQGYRTAHHGPVVTPPATWPMRALTIELPGAPTPRRDRTAVVFDDGSLKVTAIEVDHAPIQPALAYRFDYRGRSVVISGDTKAHAPLARAAAGADLLLTEAISRPLVEMLETAARDVRRDRVAAIMHDVQDYHVSPEEAAALGNAAGVKLVAYYHLLPAPDNPLARRAFARGVAGVRKGDWTIAEDGSLYTLPVGSDAVRIGRVDP